MGIFDKVMGEFRRMAHTEEDEEEDFDSLEAPRTYERSERGVARRSREKTTGDWEKDKNRRTALESESRGRLLNREQQHQQRAASSIVDIQTSTLQQVVLSKPKDFSEVTNIADNLCSKFTILLNMEDTDKDVARRIIDFIAGVAYANEGKVSMVNENFFLVTPFTVNLVSEILDGLENQGVFYKT